MKNELFLFNDNYVDSNFKYKYYYYYDDTVIKYLEYTTQTDFEKQYFI